MGLFIKCKCRDLFNADGEVCLLNADAGACLFNADAGACLFNADAGACLFNAAVGTRHRIASSNVRDKFNRFASITDREIYFSFRGLFLYFKHIKR